ncbi:hypothetical protein CQW23_18683 [Capsicum baccatum]|uniref:USP domain-containing protein n=1 Tax=Capsicum baccatum TaxID=33114 RepID=A0A2G2W3S0_CAPBA|nr:hypothetical protein CQW23_18683 [Capsicum baccatum]
MDLEWFADDGPIDDKPISSIEPKYDFEVKPIVESKYDFEVKPIRSLEPKCDFEAKPISSIGPKCDFEAEPISLVRPKCDFEAKPIKSLDLKCDFARANEEKRLVWTSNVLKTYKGAGLLNLGNTCFLNAVLQCFMNIVPLFDLLLHNAHVVPCDLLIGLSLVYEAYEGRSVSPWRLVENLIYFTSGFHKYEQEDAQEFLQCFLNRLESRCSDIVQQVFCIRLVSKLRCCNWGHYSNTYVPLIDLSMEIKDVDNLHSALETFTRVEKLDDPEIKFCCEICNVQVSIEKQLMLYNVPTISIFHLKRFQNNGSVERKISRVHEDLVLAEEAYIMFYAKRDTLCFSDFGALQKHNVDTIPKLSFSLSNHHASDVSQTNAAAVDTSSSAPRPTDAINSSYFHELMKIVDNE